MADLTPAAVVANLSTLSRQLGVQADEVEELDRVAVAARLEYKRAYAEAFLRAEGPMDQRKYLAEVETSELALKAELAEQVLRAGRESLRVLRDRLDVGRSLGAIMRMEWQGQ